MLLRTQMVKSTKIHNLLWNACKSIFARAMANDERRVRWRMQQAALWIIWIAPPLNLSQRVVIISEKSRAYLQGRPQMWGGERMLYRVTTRQLRKIRWASTAQPSQNRSDLTSSRACGLWFVIRALMPKKCGMKPFSNADKRKASYLRVRHKNFLPWNETKQMTPTNFWTT